MVNLEKSEKYGFSDLLGIMEKLRGKGGCPWDAEQTHASIRQNLLEEAYEAAEAIDLGDGALLTEELGDVLLQVVFHAQIAKESGEFDIHDVTDGICRKLIERHPHIFSGLALSGGTEEVLSNWEAIKNKSKDKTPGQAVNEVAKSLPALMRAEKVLSRAKKAGHVPPEKGETAAELAALAAQYADKPDGETAGRLLLAAAELLSGGSGAEEALARETERFAKKFG